MPGRSQRSGRVVICDDVSWSEPSPRGRHQATELEPPQWVAPTPAASPEDRQEAIALRERRHRESPRGSGRPRRYSGPRATVRPPGDPVGIEDLDGGLEEDLLDARAVAPDTGSWSDEPLAEAELLELEPLDDEAVWGPRPETLLDGDGGRRTIVITGHGDDRLPVLGHPGDPGRALRRGARRGSDLPARGIHADRTAMWAVLLGVMLLLVALTGH